MSDFTTKLAEARRRLPLPQVIEQRGKGPGNDNWKSFPKCPFCGGETCAGVFTPKSSNGAEELFKCHHEPCLSNNQALDEIGFIAQCGGLSREEAWKAYFKEAGVLRDHESHAPSVMPGKAARRLPELKGNEDETLVQDCIGVLRAEGKGSIDLLQRRLKMGYTRAVCVMEELERRGVVGPARAKTTREILNLPSAEATTPSPAEPSANSAPAGALESESAAGATVTHGTAPGSNAVRTEPSRLHRPGPRPFPESLHNIHGVRPELVTLD